MADGRSVMVVKMPDFRAATRRKKAFVAETALKLFAERGFDHVYP